MNTKAFFPSGEGSNLILGIRTENQIFFLRTPAAVKFFHQIVKKWHFGITGAGGIMGMSNTPHDGGHPSMPPVIGAVTDAPMTVKQL